MRVTVWLAAGLCASVLTACGGSAEEPPISQIVVREPGDPPVNQSGNDPLDLVAMGEVAFSTCSGCHVADAGEPSRAGPNLYGVVGRKAGLLEDFAYSSALTESGITWSEAELGAFLSNPSAKIPGTTMVAGAVSNEESRAAIVAYLASLSE